MTYLVIDTESTGAQRESKGSALDPRNRLCYIGYCSDNDCVTVPIEYEFGVPFGDALNRVKLAVSAARVLVFFNAKHDLHWLRRYGITINSSQEIWDCQLAEFILNGQTEPFPNLNDTAIRYGGHGKHDIVDDEYWSKGRDTDDVPADILSAYLAQDVLETKRIFLGQKDRLSKLPPRLSTLIHLNCQDELITEDMEWNGLKFDIEGLLNHASELEHSIVKITYELSSLLGDTRINWDSPTQVSAVLYGGIVTFSNTESYLFYYKNAKKPPVEKQRKINTEVVFPRLVEPLERTESADGKSWSTADKVLRKLKASAKGKRIIDLILERRGTQTQINRYFRGIPKIYEEMGWGNGIVHGQLHHVVAATGRLSSSKPNMQNIDERARCYLQTRFKM